MDTMYTQIKKTAETDRIDLFIKELPDGTRVKAMGHLVWLWLNSQTRLKVSGSMDEIIEWSLGDRRIFDALLKARYLEPVQPKEGDTNLHYRIKGNSGPVEHLLRSADRREFKRGHSAETTRPKGTRHPCLPVTGDEVKIGNPESEGIPPSASALDASNIKSVETPVKKKSRRKATATISESSESTEKKKTSRSRRKDATQSLEEQKQRMPGVFVWMSYKAAFLKRHGVEPVRNAKVNAQCQTLAKNLGVELAEKVVAYYIGRNDAFYVNAKHDLGLCVTQGQKLLVEMQTGKEITMTEARRIETQGATKKAVTEYLEEQEAL